jgi:hypothetical protein
MRDEGIRKDEGMRKEEWERRDEGMRVFFAARTSKFAVVGKCGRGRVVMRACGYKRLEVRATETLRKTLLKTLQKTSQLVCELYANCVRLECDLNAI